MAKTVFIAGSIAIKRLDDEVKARIENIARNGLNVVVGDANGADSSVQRELQRLNHQATTVYCSGEYPRNNIGHWPIHKVEARHARGSRAFYTAKDVSMAEAADYGLMIWDTKSPGTLSNVLELLERDKKCVVYINKDKLFVTISNVDRLIEELVSRMSESDIQAADQKIELQRRIAKMKNKQSQMFTNECSQPPAPEG